MDVDSTVPVVKSMLLLDSEGKRIAVKYYAPEWYAFHQSNTNFPPGRMLQTFFGCLLLACLTRQLSRRSTVTAQANYEKSVFSKTSRTNARLEGAAVQRGCARTPVFALQRLWSLC